MEDSFLGGGGRVIAGGGHGAYSALPVRTCGPGAVAVRDSKDPHGPTLAFSRDSWRIFARRVKTDAL